MTDKKLIVLLSVVVIVTVCLGFFVTNNDISVSDWAFRDDSLAVDESTAEPSHVYKVNINTADKYELTTLPHINDAIADAIIKRRETRGDFKYVEQLAELEEISEYIYFQIKDYVATSSDSER